MKSVKKTIKKQGHLTLERWLMKSETMINADGSPILAKKPKWFLCVDGLRVSFDLGTKSAGLIKFDKEAANIRL